MLPNFKISSFLTFVLVLFSNIDFSLAGISQQENCNLDMARSKYYFIQLEDVAPVSVYFRNIPDKYFTDKNMFLGLTGQRTIISEYFDNKNQDLLSAGVELVHIVNLNEESYSKRREMISLISPDGAIENFKVKKYKKKITRIDKHKLLGKIQRKKRDAFVSKIESHLTSRAVSLLKQIEATQLDLSQIYLHYGRTIGSLNLTRIRIANYGIPNIYVVLKLEFDSVGFKTLNSDERHFYTNIICEISSTLERRFPNSVSMNRFGYKELDQLANSVLPLRGLFRVHPWIYTSGQIIILMVIGFLLLYFPLARYKRKRKYRTIGFDLSGKDR